MSEILDKAIVLKLNAAWQRLDFKTVRDTITDMTGGNPKHPPALAIDFGYAQREDGTWDTSAPIYMNPVKWDQWIQLPVRECDLFIQTGRGRIRVPTVVIAPNYKSMPLVRQRPNRRTIYERDGGVCQYTGVRVPFDAGNLDHVLARARGGADTFENLVWAAKPVNTKKADKSPEEVGLKLLRKPKAIPPMPRSFLVKGHRHPEHAHVTPT